MFKIKKTQNKNSLPEFKSKKIKDNLAEIYNDNDEEFDIEHLEKKPKGRLKMFFTSLFSCFFLVFIFFLVGWVIFNRPQKVKSPEVEKSILLSIEAPEKISSGEEIIYKIKYKNQDKVKITKLQLILSYPDGFIFESSGEKPDNKYKNVFNLPDIKPWEEKELIIKGRLIGEEGESKSLLASLSYEPENFSSEFQELATAGTLITSAAFNLKIDGPSQVIPEKQVEYTINISNRLKEPVKNLRLIVIYPENFFPEDFSIAPRKQKDIKIEDVPFGYSYNFWIIENMGCDGQEIKIKGIFKENLKGKEKIIAKIEIGEEEGQDYNLIAEDILDIKAVDKDIVFDLILNGSREIQSVNFGDNLSYSIIYENKGKEDLKNIKVRTYIKGYEGEKEANILDWSGFKDENNGFVQNGEVLWTSAEILKLSSFSAGEEGVIDFFIPLKTAKEVFQDNNSGGDFKIKSWAEMEIGKVGDTEVEMKIKSNEIVTQINTNIILNAEARYFNDDNIAVGSGPIPPRVGQTTYYRIFWDISGNLSRIDDISVKTKLPNKVYWSDKFNTEIGEVNYNEETKEVVWKINNLPSSTAKVSLDFEIGITPQKDDLNKIMVLCDKTSLEAIDKKTGSKLTAFYKALTTDLENDPTMSGRGLVEE